MLRPRTRAFLPLSEDFGVRSRMGVRSTFAHFPVVKGLVSYWPFIEGSGATVHDYWGTNNGTLNMTDHWSTGRFGNAYDFDGTDDYVSVPQSDTFDIASGVGFTVGAWIKSDALSGVRKIFTLRHSGVALSVIILQTDGTDLGCYVYNDLRTSQCRGVAGVTLSTGTWYYVCLTRNQSGNVSIWLDGASHSIGTCTGPITNQDQGPYIGVHVYTTHPGGIQFFDGIIDEVCIWNRALKRSEIVSMMYRRREG